IKVTSVAPGAFRTDFLDDSSAHFGSVPLPEYKTFSDKICSSSANNNHKQPGAPEKRGQAIVELALDPGAPLHFIVGSDAVRLAETQLASRKQEMQRWRNLATSTDARHLSKLGPVSPGQSVAGTPDECYLMHGKHPA